MSEWKQRQLDRQAKFWAQVRVGATFTAACEAAGVERHQGYRWRKVAGGRIPPVPRIGCGRYLSLPERLQIADLRLAGKGVRAIAAERGRAPSTISRELARNRLLHLPRSRSRSAAYAPYAAHTAAQVQARRPKPSKLEHRELAGLVEARLRLRWSPQQISADLAALHPDRAEMRVSHETIYQSLFVQGRGHLRADLHKQLRTGRAVRRPRGTLGRGQTVKIPNPISISERPAEAADRAIPGHWEGDLILGANCRSAIGTLVERSTRYVMLLHLPDVHDAITVRDRLIPLIATLPAHLRRSLTWDRGTELARHHDITLATKMAIYFCDPHSPWQRGSNENTNGPLRQYFPKARTWPFTLLRTWPRLPLS